MPAQGQISPFRRALPDDFREVQAKMTWLALKEHYRCGERTLHRWMAESGCLDQRRTRALPDNVADMAKTMCISEIAQATGWKRSTLRERLAKEMPAVHAMAVNNGYAKQAEGARKGSPVAAAARWANAERHPAIERPKASGKQYKFAPSRANIGTEQAMPKSRADLAMRFLQRFGVCYPRRVHHRVLDGYVFSLCPGVLTADEIVAEAEKRGWRVDSWEVAA